MDKDIHMYIYHRDYFRYLLKANIEELYTFLRAFDIPKQISEIRMLQIDVEKTFACAAYISIQNFKYILGFSKYNAYI